MQRHFQIIYLILIVGSICSCRKERTSWDTNWTAPIAYGSLGLEDMIQDSVFSVNPDSTLNLIFKSNIVDLNFDSIFKLPDTTIQEKIALAINLDIPPGTSFLNQVEERQFEIDNAEIKEIGIKSGGATVLVKNPIETGVYLTITLPGVEKQGVDLSVTAFVVAGTPANPTSFELYVDFTGYLMDLRGSDGNSWNTLVSIFDVQSDPNGDSVLVTTQDSIEINVSFENVLPDYGKGYFGTRTLSSADTIDLDFMRNFVSGSLLIDSVNMNLNIINGVAVMATGVVNQLTSINNNISNIINLNHSVIGQNININPATGSWNSLNPFVYPININSGNSNIQNFIQNLPDQLILDYDILINPLGNVSGGNDAFYPLSEMTVELDLNMPTRFSADHLQFVDTLDLSLEQNPESSRITSGHLTLSADNYFPFDLNVNLIFLDEQGFVLDTLLADGYLMAGIPDMNGKVNLPMNSEINYAVSETIMEMINRSKKIVIWADLNNQNHPLSYDLYQHYTVDFQIKSDIGLKVEF